MTDQEEKLVDIVCQAMQEGDCIGHCNYPPCFKVCAVVDELISHGVTVKEPQKPVKFNKMPLSDYCWIEHKYTLSSTIGPAEILCIMDKYCRINFIGCGSPIVHKKADYGKTWRCWAEKPTEEERNAAEWL